MRGRPRIDVEEIDGDELVVRVTAAPLTASDGAALADELLAALAEVSRETGARREGRRAGVPAAAGDPYARDDVIAGMRIKAPTRGNRRLEALIAAANDDDQLKGWWGYGTRQRQPALGRHTTRRPTSRSS